MSSELCRQIAQAVCEGADLDTIERVLIAPAGLDEEERAALWLYAEAVRDPRRPERELVLFPG